MSCGTRLKGRFGDSYIDRDELAEKLEEEGEYGIARQVRRGDCLDDSQLRHAERALDWQNMSKNFDYKEERCRCESDDEEV